MPNNIKIKKIMDIITFSEGLQKRLKEIDSLASGQNDLLKMGQALRFIREIMAELKQFTVKYSFVNTEEEIKFFKEVKPVLLSQYFYYRRMFAIQLFDSFRDRKSRIENYYHILQKLQNFARKNQEFYQYCMSGATYLDGNYFTRNKQNLPGVDSDEKFTTNFDSRLAKILAHELIKSFIMNSLHKLHDDITSPSTTSLSWTESKVALVELIYALHDAGVFNKGQSDIKQIVRCFEEQFSVDLGNYARVFSEIRIRKSGQTNFLDHLRERLSQFIKNLD